MQNDVYMKVTVLAFIYREHGASPQQKFCLREHDYVINDRKIGGNAQTITKDRFVHHTSFLWNFDAKKMSYLKVKILHVLNI